MNEEMLDDEMLVRCFTCSEIRSIGELEECYKCHALRCGYESSKCTGRCICSSLRHLEHPEDAKAFYAILDKLNVCEDRTLYAELERQLKVFEIRHGW